MKLYFYMCILLLTTFVYGQQEEKFTISKGTKELEIAFNYNYQKVKAEGATVNPITHNFTVAPSVGYAIKDNIVIGAQIQFQAIRQTTDGDEFERRFAPDLQTYGISFFPYIMKYISLSKALLLNLKGRVGYESLKQEDYNENETEKANEFSIGIAPGLTYALSSKLALKAEIGFLGYSSTERKNSNSQQNGNGKMQNFDFRLNSSNLLFGLVYFIK